MVCMPKFGGKMSPYCIKRSRSGSPDGFTVVELMVTLAVIGILAVIATPSMTALINNSRVAGQTEELVASLQLARAEAIRRNARVTVCAGAAGACSGSGTWGGWTIFGRDNTLAVPANDVIRDTTASPSMQVTGPTGGIVFKPSGMIDSQLNLEVAKSSDKRCLSVLISGVVSVAKGACP